MKFYELIHIYFINYKKRMQITYRSLLVQILLSSMEKNIWR